ncbi:O-methyltransferase [Endozoicomonadaceae bacterium StTr2]
MSDAEARQPQPQTIEPAVDITHPEIEAYCESLTTPEPELLQELVTSTYDVMAWPGKLSGRLVGRTLKLLAGLLQARNVLEIGMFTGYSALSLAEALPDDGKVTCCETNPKAIEFAQTFFDRSPHGHKITPLFGNAMETVPTLDQTYDLVFIDADKRNYFNYLKLTEPKVREGGLIIIDNALWKGNVLNPEDVRDQAIDEMNRYIAESPVLENVFLPIADGLNVIRKVTP